MNTRNKLHQLHAKDQSLRWMMRIIGLVLVAVSAFFVTRDFTQTASAAVWFFGFCAALGTVTLVTSWMPGPKKPQFQESRVTTTPRHSH